MDLGSEKGTTGTGRRPLRIVILGGGFAGAYCAQALERRLRRDGAEIILIDAHNYFAFTPLLIEAGTGGVEPRHCVVSIRSFLKRTAFRQGKVTGVDLEKREVTFRPPQHDSSRPVDFNHLIIAMGSVTRMPDVPGLAEHGHELKSLADAVALRDRAIEMLEAANLEPDSARRRSMLHFVVVGGNYTGVEVAGEFQAFFSEARRQYPALRRDDYRITLVELRDRILPALGDDLARYAADKMAERGIDIRTGESVERIEAASATLSGGDVLPTRTVIWCAGVAPPPLVARTTLPVDDRGYIECERDLRVRGCNNVWAIGDCAVNHDADGHPYPATAQHAVKQAEHAAKNIQRVLSGEPTEPCDIRTTGSLAALGCRTAVADILGVKVAGFAAWWLWRTVYLMKMPGWGRRLRIAADWTLDLLSRRELVQLGVHRPVARHADGEQPRDG